MARQKSIRDIQNQLTSIQETAKVLRRRIKDGGGDTKVLRERLSRAEEIANRYQSNIRGRASYQASVDKANNMLMNDDYDSRALKSLREERDTRRYGQSSYMYNVAG